MQTGVTRFKKSGGNPVDCARDNKLITLPVEAVWETIFCSKYVPEYCLATIYYTLVSLQVLHCMEIYFKIGCTAEVWI